MAAKPKRLQLTPRSVTENAIRAVFTRFGCPFVLSFSVLSVVFWCLPRGQENAPQHIALTVKRRYAFVYLFVTIIIIITYNLQKTTEKTENDMGKYVCFGHEWRNRRVVSTLKTARVQRRYRCMCYILRVGFWPLHSKFWSNYHHS